MAATAKPIRKLAKSAILKHKKNVSEMHPSEAKAHHKEHEKKIKGHAKGHTAFTKHKGK